MADHIKIRKAPGTWVIRAGGAVIGETRNALELVEDPYPAVIYFPRADIAMAMMESSPTHSTCPSKGAASYYSLVTKSGTIHNAAWSYETPKDGVAAIKGHLAFYPEKVTVEQL